MSRAPNAEQKIAIEHQGGVLLEAGAGSGKTFVLVEHIFYLLEKFYKELQGSSIEELEVQLTRKMSSIIMMTFTNKAAGEMALRLQDRASEYIAEVDEQRGQLFLRCLDALNILTIDGFCSKLVKEGFITTISNRFEIVDEISYYQKISSLLEEWFESQADNYARNSDLWEMLLLKFDALIDNFISVFSSAEMRLLWKVTTVDEMLDFNKDEFLQTILKLEGIITTLPPCPFGDKYFREKQSDPARIYFKQIDALNIDISTYRGFEQAVEFFTNNSKSFGTSGPKNDEAKEWKHILKEIRFFCMSLGKMLAEYEEHKSKLVDWISLLKDIFEYVEKNYLNDNYFCFADLSYYVYLGLENHSVVENILGNYSYFIVDEFQDTSQIQFDILSRIMNDDFSRLFAVGDKKQAIYAFRGGEVTVFNRCSEIMSKQRLQNLQLTNNYRSLGNVINFNNELFTTIFPYGKEFSGKDQFAVDVVKQTIPLEEKQKQGELFTLDVQVTGENKIRLSNYELNLLESQAFIQHIDYLLEHYPGDKICILYRSLTPLAVMFPLLLQGPINFTSQVKISQAEDPIVLLFSFVIYALYEGETEEQEEIFRLYARLMQGVMYYLQINIELNSLIDILEKIAEHYSLFGLHAAINRCMYELGIANSNYVANMNSISTVINEAHNQLDLAYELVQGNFNDRYSIEFQKGDGGSVIIMTAHASKGLEFDHVLMGGISTNGRSSSSQEYFGKMPGSLKWKYDSTSRKMVDTPQFYLEKLITSYKDFAESKRLFYVVGTRAVKTLSWVEISVGEEKTRQAVKNSWVYGIDRFKNYLSRGGEVAEELIDVLDRGKIHIQISYPLQTKFENRSMLYHIDNLGVDYCERMPDREQLLVLSELAVTSLAALHVCPKRFYLHNILKLDPADFDFLEEDLLADTYKQYVEEDRKAEDISYLPNSAMRGTRIHQAIFLGITEGDYSSLREELEQRDAKAIDWALDLVRSREHHVILRAEVELKFDFFGMRISGTPDLILIDEQNMVIEIWDYKTGQRNCEKEDVYLRQLQYYSYGVTSSQSDYIGYSLKACLLYVDLQEVVEFEFKYDQLKKELFLEFSKMNNLLEQNNSKCDFCKFKQLCRL